MSAQEWSNAHIPPDYDPGEVAARFVKICKAEGIPYIEPSGRFREAAKRGNDLYYAHDPHWTTAGNPLAAEILAESLRGSWSDTQQ